MKKSIAVVLVLLLTAAVLSGAGRSGLGLEKSQVRKEAGKQEKESKKTKEEDADRRKERAAEILSSMTLEEKVAQMMMPAFRTWTKGKSALDVTELNKEQEALIKKYPFGGVILFAENLKTADQSRDLIREIQDASLEGFSRAALLIAADQEGGRVSRLAYGTQMPGNMALGASGDPDAARHEAALMGEELSSLGFNLDFAPVMDVNSNPANPVIGLRSFSDDPEAAGALGAAFTKGLHSRGIISALKHFPGHGDTDTDSHTGLPVIDKSLEDLHRCELIPFERGLQEADMVMTAHILYPQIETKTYVSRQDGKKITLPATLSRTIITGILREELGFDGVVITDSMKMSAVAAHFDPMDAVRLAINAGVDMILMPVDLSTKEGIASLEDYISGITSMVEKEKISEERVNEAVTRILILKDRYGLLDADSLSLPEDSVGSRRHHEEEWKLALRAVTMLKNRDRVLPLKNREKILIAAADSSQVNSAVYAALKAREEGILPAETEILTRVSSEMTPEEAGKIPKGVDSVIGISAVNSLSALNPSKTDGAGTACLKALFKAAEDKGIRTVLISSQLPYDVAAFPEADAVLCCYNGRGMAEIPEIPDFQESGTQEYGPNLPAALYTAFGGSTPEGKLPVNIPVLLKNHTFGDQILFERGMGLSYD